MKALSLWQPWASAIALGSKRIETRGWPTRYRGPLAIHAAKRMNKNELTYFKCVWNWCGALAGAGLVMGGKDQLYDLLPFGALVATCQLVDCRPAGSFTGDEIDAVRRPPGATSPMLDWTERQMGNFELGRFGWVLADVVPLATPIPCRGMQGLFDVPDELLDGREHNKFPAGAL